MPFLVDSVTMEFNRHEIGTQLVVHPQMRVRRDMTGKLLGRGEEDITGQMLAESWMHFEIDRQNDPAVLEQLETDLQRVLEDVRNAVEDFAKMRALALQTAEDVSANPPPLRPHGDRGQPGAAALAGRRALHLPRLPRIPPGGGEDGDGCARCPARAWASSAHDKVGSDSFAALPPRCAPRPARSSC